MPEQAVKVQTLRRLYNQYWVRGDLDSVDEVLDPAIAGFATGRASGVRTDIKFAITVGFADDGRIASIHEYATLPEATGS